MSPRGMTPCVTGYPLVPADLRFRSHAGCPRRALSGPVSIHPVEDPVEDLEPRWEQSAGLPLARSPLDPSSRCDFLGLPLRRARCSRRCNDSEDCGHGRQRGRVCVAGTGCSRWVSGAVRLPGQLPPVERRPAIPTADPKAALSTSRRPPRRAAGAGRYTHAGRLRPRPLPVASPCRA